MTRKSPKKMSDASTCLDDIAENKEKKYLSGADFLMRAERSTMSSGADATVELPAANATSLDRGTTDNPEADVSKHGFRLSGAYGDHDERQVVSSTGSGEGISESLPVHVLRRLSLDYKNLIQVFNAESSDVDSAIPIIVCECSLNERLERMIGYVEGRTVFSNNGYRRIRIGGLSFYFCTDSKADQNEAQRKFSYEIYLIKLLVRYQVALENDRSSSTDISLVKLKEVILESTEKSFLASPSIDQQALAARIILCLFRTKARQLQAKQLLKYVSFLLEERGSLDDKKELRLFKLVLGAQVTDLLDTGLAFLSEFQDTSSQVKAEKYSSTAVSTQDVWDTFRSLVATVAIRAQMQDDDEVYVIADASADGYFVPLMQELILDRFYVSPMDRPDLLGRLYFAIFAFLFANGRIIGAWGEMKLKGDTIVLMLNPSESFASPEPNDAVTVEADQSVLDSLP